MTEAFDGVLAIDWSGAARADGIAVAEWRDGVVSIVPPPEAPDAKGRRAAWTRHGVVSGLVRLARGHRRVLVGLDFPFSMPASIVNLVTEGQSLPVSAPSLWAFVDAAAGAAPDLYGRPAADAAIWRDRFYRGGKLEEQPLVRRLFRETEKACAAEGLGTPWSALDLHVQNVGLQALAGMRVLHRLRAELGPKLAVWPFDDAAAAGVTLILAEVFPRSFIPRPLGGNRKVSGANLAAVLAHHHATIAGDTAMLDTHATDALVSVAAVRAAWTSRPAATVLPAEAGVEGWMLGVPPP